MKVTCNECEDEFDNAECTIVFHRGNKVYVCTDKCLKKIEKE